MGRVLLVVLAACGSSPPPAPPLKNIAPGSAHVEPASSPCGVASFANRGMATFVGAICDPQTREWLSGATLVLTRANHAGEEIGITDERGVFGIPVSAGDYTVTYYYADCTWIRHHHVDGRDTPPVYELLIQKGCK